MLTGIDYPPYGNFPIKNRRERISANEETNMRKSRHIKKEDLDELPYERPVGGYEQTFDLKKEDISNVAQAQHLSVIHAPSSGIIKGLRTSVIQHTHSLPKRYNQYVDKKDESFINATISESFTPVCEYVCCSL